MGFVTSEFDTTGQHILFFMANGATCIAKRDFFIFVTPKDYFTHNSKTIVYT